MRLTADEVVAIKASAQEVFGSDVVVRLFGSRLHDNRRGGDIDLHLQVPMQDRMSGATGQFRQLLNQRIGEREYDILIAAQGTPLSAVDCRAMAEGLVL